MVKLKELIKLKGDDVDWKNFLIFLSAFGLVEPVELIMKEKNIALNEEDPQVFFCFDFSVLKMNREILGSSLQLSRKDSTFFTNLPPKASYLNN